MDEINTEQTKVPENIIKEEKEICEECGREFTGPHRKAAITGHMRSHKVRERVDINPEDRKKRIPFGIKERKWNIPENDGYSYRIFNDNWTVEPGRIQRALRAGYEIVENQDHSAVGTNENGSEIKGVLMRIPNEFYDEDQKLKQKAVDEIDRKIKGGTLEQAANDKRYSRDGIKIWNNNTENP